MVEIERKYEALRNALAAADTDQIIAKLTELKEFVVKNIDRLDLYTDKERRVEASRADVRLAFESMLELVQMTIRELQIGSSNVKSIPRSPQKIDKQGRIDGGRTLQLTLLVDPITPGGLDIFMTSDELAISELPPGYQFAKLWSLRFH